MNEQAIACLQCPVAKGLANESSNALDLLEAVLANWQQGHKPSECEALTARVADALNRR